MAIVGMVLKPGVQVAEGLSVFKLVRKADSKSEQAIQIVGVSLMRFFESKDSEIILVVLLVQLA